MIEIPNKDTRFVLEALENKRNEYLAANPGLVPLYKNSYKAGGKVHEGLRVLESNDSNGLPELNTVRLQEIFLYENVEASPIIKNVSCRFFRHKDKLVLDELGYSDTSYVDFFNQETRDCSPTGKITKSTKSKRYSNSYEEFIQAWVSPKLLSWICRYMSWPYCETRQIVISQKSLWLRINNKGWGLVANDDCSNALVLLLPSVATPLEIEVDKKINGEWRQTWNIIREKFDLLVDSFYVGDLQVLLKIFNIRVTKTLVDKYPGSEKYVLENPAIQAKLVEKIFRQ